MNMHSTPEGAAEVAAPADFPPSMIRGLDYAFLQVRGFHKVMGQPAPDAPSLQPYEHVKRRADWIRSECEELEDPDKQTITDQTDAYMDIIYFGLGGLVEIGVLPQSVLDIVNGANMAKVWPDGSVRRREDGKIIKPDNWERDHAPEERIAAEIQLQSKHRPLLTLSA